MRIPEQLLCDLCQKEILTPQSRFNSDSIILHLPDDDVYHGKELDVHIACLARLLPRSAYNGEADG